MDGKNPIGDAANAAPSGQPAPPIRNPVPVTPPPIPVPPSVPPTADTPTRSGGDAETTVDSPAAPIPPAVPSPTTQGTPGGTPAQGERTVVPPPLPPDAGPATPTATPVQSPRPVAAAPAAGNAAPLRPILVAPQAITAVAQSFEDDAESEEQSAFDFETRRFLKAAPPWMISLIFHMALIIILGILFFPPTFRNALDLEAVFSDTVGEQLDEFVELSALDSPELEQAMVVEEEMIQVDDPLASPPVLDVPTDDFNPVNSFEVPAVGAALTGRDVGMKKALLKAYGGTAETEAAVQLGLEWLKRRQEKVGSWSLVGPYSKGGAVQNRIAATSMALLAFQGAGTTHQKGRYNKEVAKGWRFMLKEQAKDGSFFKRVAAPNHRFYTHAQATIAICELYGMTRDPELREPAQKAIDYLCDMQDAAGGWRYYPKQGSDLSVTGWVLMALQSGRMAGLIVPSPVFERISKFLDRVEDLNGARYGYMSGDAFTESMTAEGLLCRQYLGWRQDDKRLVSGAEYVA
ncbi:MAG: prenyltransferase/squalene oxidase repeat-containing protein, partial [Planctomycetota bacterium]